jgi:hypothetical protein
LIYKAFLFPGCQKIVAFFRFLRTAKRQKKSQLTILTGADNSSFMELGIRLKTWGILEKVVVLRSDE